MQSKRAFTLVELIAVITILSILLILVTPAITNVGKNSRISLRDSKIQSILTVSEKYGNEVINEYQECLGTMSSSELAQNCTLKLSTLVDLGYLKDEDVKDPVTDEELTGKVLLCYDPSRVNIYTTYVEDDNFSCKDIAINSDNTLSLSSAGGVGYVGGKELNVSIIKSGEFTGFSCESSDDNLATCEIEGSKLKIIMPERDKVDFGEDKFKDVTINVIGDYNDDDGVARKLNKAYDLKVYPTSLEIIDDGKTCIPSGSSISNEISVLNAGVMSVVSSDADIMEGTAKDGTLYISTKGKTGIAKLTVKENNGNASSSIEKTVYKMDISENFPENMVINHTADIKIEHGGTGKIRIYAEDREVVKFSKNSALATDEIVLDTEDTFKIFANRTGITKIHIEGENCGSIVRDISVSSLAFKDETRGVVYVGGNRRSVEVEVEEAHDMGCSSSNPDAATCEVHATTVEIIPGSVPADNVILTVGSREVGYAYYRLQVLKTTIDVVNSSGRKITNVCREKGSSYNSDQLFVRGTNLGKTELLELEDWYLAEASIPEEGAERNLMIYPRLVEEAIPPYKLGENTGRTKVEVQEHNGNQIASFYYNIYTLEMSSSSVRMKVDETYEFEVEASGTGELSVSSSNRDVATVEILGSTSFDWTPNATNKIRVRITAVGTGGASINIRGSSCGNETFSVQVEGKSLSIRLVPGTYTTRLGAEVLSCETEGLLRTCEVEFPPIYTSSEFQVVGYNKTKDSTTATYKPGDRLTLNIFNNGSTFYGNSMDLTAPVCSVNDSVGHIKKGETGTLTMTCIDTGSGIKGSGVLSTDDFIVSNREIGTVTKVSEPVRIANGYSYEISLQSKENGLLSLSLKSGVLVDMFSNGNAKTTLDSLLVSEYEMEEYYYIGKNNRKDVLAVLIANAELGGSAGDYSLYVYGSGEMLDFMSSSYSHYAPWYDMYRTSITNVVVEEGITNIGSKFMYNATNLRNIALPGSVTKIGDSAFTNADIINLTLPNSVMTIGNEAFYGNRNLSLLKLSENLESIGSGAFYNHQIKTLTIPSRVSSIGDRAFGVEAERSSLNVLEFSAGSVLKTIGNSAFIYHELDDLTIPRTVTRIGARAFEQVDIVSGTLKNLIIPDDSMLTTIEDDAFAYCHLNSLSLPESLERIGSRAFAGLRDGIEQIELGKNVNSIGDNFAYGSNLKNITVASGNRFYTSADGILYNFDKTTLVKCPDDYYVDHSTLNVSTATKTIQAGAFDGWLNYGSQVSGLEVNLPASITNMNIEDNFIFFAASKININNSQFSSINGVLFNRAKSTIIRLPLVYGSTSYEIPDTVNTVSDYFSYGNSKVKQVTIPNSVTKIGTMAFAADPKYAFEQIDIYSEGTLVFDETSFQAMVYPASESISSRSRTINVANTTLKGRLENVYQSVPYNLVINKVGG